MTAPAEWSIGDKVRLVMGEDVGVIEDLVDAWDQPGARIRWEDGHASPEVLAHLRAPHEFTVEQIEQGIAWALRDRRLEFIPGMLKLLAVQAPDRAHHIYNLLVHGMYIVTDPVR